MWHQKIMELSEQLEHSHDAESFWGLCHRALEDAGIIGVGYAIVPMRTELEVVSSASEAAFFRHTYPTEWEHAVESDGLLDDDITTDLLLGGIPKVDWNADGDLFGATKGNKRLKQIEDDLGITWGSSVLLAHHSSDVVTSGIGLWAGHVKSDAEYARYWAEHEDFLMQVSHLLDTGLRNEQSDAIVKLSPREKDCLTYVAIGLRRDEIAFRLGTTPKTVDKQIKSAKDKLNARTRDHAVAKALRLKVIQP